MTEWTPPVAPCSASDPSSFAYESTVKRWPTILTGVIDELATLNGHLLKPEDADKLRDSKEIIQVRSLCRGQAVVGTDPDAERAVDRGLDL